MRWIAVVLLMGGAMHVQAEVENFDAAPVGQLPKGWKCGVTGHGRAEWVVSSDTTAPSPPNVLLQKGEGAFPWCVKEGVTIEHGFAEVRFKPMSGKDDQAGGLVWRWKDADNYYVARANALENNVSVYHTIGGRRNTIKYVNAPVAARSWHVLRVDFAGAAIKVTLDGKTYIDLKDTHIAGGGAVGVWTKADSVTAFDDFSWGDAVKR